MTVRILNLEDDERDSLLIQQRLEAGGLQCELVRVESEVELLRAVDGEAFDLIIADFNLPSFDGTRGLELARKLRPETPFIFFSGVLGEEAAIESLRNGATDYVLKQRPRRLLHAVTRALEQAEESRRRRIAEDALRLKDAAIASSMAGFAIADLDGKVTYVNQSALRLWGYEREEDVLGRPADSFWTSPEHARELFSVVRRHGHIVTELELTRTDGSPGFVQVVANFIRDENHRPTCITAWFIDITERRHVGESLMRLSRAVEQAADVIFMTDRDGTIGYVNPAFERVYGYPPEEAIGKTPRILHSGYMQPAHYENFWRQILSGGVFRGEFVNKAKDGGIVVADACVSPLLNGDGEIGGFIAVQTDITERKKSEQEHAALKERMFHIGKMEAIGTLAGGIAHDFNNILAIVLSFCSVAERSRDDPNQFAKAIGTIRQAVQRGADLARQILTFARKRDTKLEPVDLNELVREVVGMLQSTFPKTIAFSTSLETDLPLIVADASQLHEALVNLCVNARDSMLQGGMIHLETAKASAEEVRERFPDTPSKQFVRIRVSDNGMGMSEEVRARIFEPFFTTKGEKGTGLGLAVAYGVAKALGGYIRFDTKEGVGTSFEIFLLMPENRVDQVGVPPERTRSAHG